MNDSATTFTADSPLGAFHLFNCVEATGMDRHQFVNVGNPGRPVVVNGRAVMCVQGLVTDDGVAVSRLFLGTQAGVDEMHTVVVDAAREEVVEWIRECPAVSRIVVDSVSKGHENLGLSFNAQAVVCVVEKPFPGTTNNSDMVAYDIHFTHGKPYDYGFDHGVRYDWTGKLNGLR